MEHRDLTQLKQDALDKVIFHMTPKEWITESGPWVLDRGDGALLYDVDGREYLERAEVWGAQLADSLVGEVQEWG
ncbi:MAG TPA: hypothetical protein VLA91_14595 [Acidimicrobiia bacterium]|nr:hypothetical protein [Acidimicrobiia bacterium]